jgi:hypothetical protein
VVRKTLEMKQLSTSRFRKSDRLLALETGSSKSIGASCNFFRVEDSIDSIAEAANWALHVSAYQGAPSLDLSALRPRNSEVSSGGSSSGAASFSKVFDSIVGSMRRPTKKNGAGVVWLDWNHPDLAEFMDMPFNYAYKGIYCPSNANPDEQRAFLASPISHSIVRWYDSNKAFVCKRPDGGLLLNLCTEIENTTRGTCVLGVLNLSQYDLNNMHELPADFTAAALDMEQAMKLSARALRTSSIKCYNEDANRQFGLGVSGLASLLANCRVSYEDFTAELEGTITNNWRAGKLARFIREAYRQATEALGGRVRAAFCVQPSATGAFESADIAGYTSSPELQPVVALRSNGSVTAIRKSALLGDTYATFHPAIETVNDVPYETYRRLCCAWQDMLDSTGLAHRHSACFYGARFTHADLSRFVFSSQRSLYYRLPSYNELALDKTQVGAGLSTADFNVDALLSGACSLSQVPGAVECDCAA